MKIFSKKISFMLGGIAGSIAGLLFAREDGKTLREKLGVTKDPQKKFEILFQEYLKVGKEAITEVKKSKAIKDILKGGKEVLAELKQKAKKEGSRAVKLAEKKTNEVIKEIKKQACTTSKKIQAKTKKVKKQKKSSTKTQRSKQK
jgi:gas vesicle protein